MAKIKQTPGSKPVIPPGMSACVIGNGTSRKGKDLKSLLPHAVVIGCNWFFTKEFRPHVLIASDEPITNSIIKLHPHYAKTNWFYTWYPKPGSGAKKAPCPEKFAAGPMGAHLAATKLQCNKVFLIGMDFFGFGSKDKNNNGGLNNLYANEKHYQKVAEGESGHAPTYRNWQRRFQWLIQQNENVEFYHVDPFEGKSPERLIGLRNFHQTTFQEMMEWFEKGTPPPHSQKREEDIALAYEENEDNVRATYERQIAGQENVIYPDPLKPEQVLQIRLKACEYYRKHGDANGYPVIKIAGFDITLPMMATRDKKTGAVRVMTDEEVVVEWKHEYMNRNK